SSAKRSGSSSSRESSEAVSSAARIKSSINVANSASRLTLVASKGLHQPEHLCIRHAHVLLEHGELAVIVRLALHQAGLRPFDRIVQPADLPADGAVVNRSPGTSHPRDELVHGGVEDAFDAPDDTYRASAAGAEIGRAHV